MVRTIQASKWELRFARRSATTSASIGSDLPKVRAGMPTCHQLRWHRHDRLAVSEQVALKCRREGLRSRVRLVGIYLAKECLLRRLIKERLENGSARQISETMVVQP